MADIQLWQAPSHEVQNFKEITDAIQRIDDSNLTEGQKRQIVSAFKAEAYDMATEYAWKKSMVKLKETLGGLGADFIGDMLDRKDIDEFSVLENVLSDSDAIKIAEQIGVLTPEGAMLLRHAKEQLTYYFSSEATQKGQFLDMPHALSIISDCVKHVLSFRIVTTDIPFMKFKRLLLENDIKTGDEIYSKIEVAPLFYLRTICSILLSAIRKENGAHLEHAATNLNAIIMSIWNRIAEEDRWNIGNTYKDMVANGNEKAANGLKIALTKVKGFDYVPETVRSDTFNYYAQKLLDVHYDFNNFYNEPQAVKALASLGSIIPKAAFAKCIRAYLCVLMGNYYGVSNAAVPIVEEELSHIARERWHFYFSQIIMNDEDVLYHFQTDSQIDRLRTFLYRHGLNDLTDIPYPNDKLYESILNSDFGKARLIAKKFSNKIRGAE